MQLLHLHEIVEGLYFHCNLSVCLCVCVSVCPALIVNKIPAERMNRFGRGFSLNGCLPYRLKAYRNLLPLVKGQGHSDVIPIFSSQVFVNFPSLNLKALMFDQNEIRYVA